MPEFPLYERPIRYGPDTRWRPTFLAVVDGRPSRLLVTITAPEGTELQQRPGHSPQLVVPLGLGRGRSVTLKASAACVAATSGDFRLGFREAGREV